MVSATARASKVVTATYIRNVTGSLRSQSRAKVKSSLLSLFMAHLLQNVLDIFETDRLYCAEVSNPTVSASTSGGSCSQEWRIAGGQMRGLWPMWDQGI